MAQTTKPVAKPDTIQITFPKQTAEIILRGLNSGNAAIGSSDVISAKQANEANQVFNFMIMAIYKKWPDLQPKQTKP